MTRTWVMVAALLGGASCGGGLPDEEQAIGTQQAALSTPAGGSSGVVVLTRNLYVGTDVGAILGAASPAEVPFLVQHARSSARR